MGKMGKMATRFDLTHKKKFFRDRLEREGQSSPSSPLSLPVFAYIPRHLMRSQFIIKYWIYLYCVHIIVYWVILFFMVRREL